MLGLLLLGMTHRKHILVRSWFTPASLKSQCGVCSHHGGALGTPDISPSLHYIHHVIVMTLLTLAQQLHEFVMFFAVILYLFAGYMHLLNYCVKVHHTDNHAHSGRSC